jgi:hypothetical protein
MGYDGLGIDLGIDLGVFDGAYADFGMEETLGEVAGSGGLEEEGVPWGSGEYVMGEARVGGAGDWGFGLGLGLGLRCERIEIV